MRMHFGRSLSGLLGLFTVVLVCSSCENFLKGTETKKQLEERIAYANAPSYEIRVDSKSRGVINSPAGGLTEKKVTDTFELTFEPLADYEFLKWTIIDSNTKKELENGLYLKLASLSEASTSCTLVKAPEKDMKLSLYPLVVKRPRVISVTPQSSDTGAYRDARIRVSFDKPMEAGSIYFTEPEITSIIDELGIKHSAFLNAGTQEAPKYYGYIFEGKKYYKNIQIENQKTGISVLEYFGIPYFEDSVTLIIPPNDPPLPANTNVSVSLEAGFFYKEASKDITLKEDYKWMYFVNSKIDQIGPSATEKIKNHKGESITNNSSSPVLISNSLQMLIKATDKGSGPYGKFYLQLTNIQNNTKESFEISFDDVTNTTAVYGTEKDPDDANSQDEYTSFEISGVADGVYKLNLLYYDKNFAQSTSEDYYVKVDNTKPVISNLDLSPYTSDTTSTNNKKTALKLTYDCNNEDYTKVTVKYKLTDNVTGDFSELTFTKDDEVIIPNLEYSEEYLVYLYFYDQIENCTAVEKTVNTYPTTVKNLEATSENTDNQIAKVHLKWDKPDGDFISYTICYSVNGANGEIKNIDKNLDYYDISNVLVNEEYTFTVKTITAKNPGAASVTHTVMPQISIANMKLQRNSFNNDYLFVSSNLGRYTNCTATLYYSQIEANVKTHDSYTVNFPSNANMFMINANTLSILINDPVNKYQPKYGETWYFAIKLTCGGETVWSDVKEYTIPVVKDLSTSIITGTGVQLSWDYVKTTGLQMIEIYIDGVSKYQNSYQVSNTRYCNIKELTPNTEYTATVKVKYNEKLSEQSITFTTSSGSGFAITKKTSVHSTAGYAIYIECTYPPGITREDYMYFYYRQRGAQNWVSVEPSYSDSTWKIGGLTNGVEYDVLVQLFKGSEDNEVDYEDFITTKPW